VLVLAALPAAAQSHTVTVVRDVDYVTNADYPDGKDRLDICVPNDARNAQVIFSIHGAALEAGDRSEERFVGERHGGDPGRVLVTGHSAGAYLAMLLAADRRWLAAHKLLPGAIAGVASVSGFYRVDREGVAPDRPTYVWATDRRVWVDASPAHYLRPDLPPVLLLDTDGDEGWRQRQKADFADALRAASHKDVTVYKVKDRTHMSVWTEMNDGKGEETSSQILFAKRLFAAP
jgi:acetyl esterase/lipase